MILGLVFHPRAIAVWLIVALFAFGWAMNSHHVAPQTLADFMVGPTGWLVAAFVKVAPFLAVLGGIVALLYYFAGNMGEAIALAIGAGVIVLIWALFLIGLGPWVMTQLGIPLPRF